MATSASQIGTVSCMDYASSSDARNHFLTAL